MIKNKKFLNIDEFYKAAIDCAMDVDPRGRKIVEKELKDIKKDYDSITDKKKKKLTDMEKLQYENMKLRIENERLKKGYLVKGDGSVVVFKK